MKRDKQENNLTGLEVAVIGMALRFPGANNIDEFWNNLKYGIESLSFFSDQELEEAGINPGLLKNPGYVKLNGGLEGIEDFDSAFFDYTPVEVEIMDPQIRFFHECVWNALEDAGYLPETYDGLIGVYAGASPNFDWEAMVKLSGEIDSMGMWTALQLMDKDYISLRVSYKLNLKGPAVNVQSACSTSLVAIHLACQSLLNGECDIALAGGSTITFLNKSGYIYQEDMAFSSDGHCRAFDDRSDGVIGGNGVGIAALKRLPEAIEDGDHIYAVIKGTAINNDGYRKIGFSAPSIEGQAEAIVTAQEMAEVEPESISYIEAHGTGTTLGDPVEIEALTLAFDTDKKGYCAIGSVKTNIGHVDAAAGVAGLLKVVLALKYKLIPPSLHFEKPNAKIDFKNTPFYVNTTLSEWKNDKYPLRAGISSFGLGGTNAHAILEEWPIGQSAERIAQSLGRGYQLILLSAKTQTALEKMAQNLAAHLKNNPGISLADTAYTLQVGRQVFKYRQMSVYSNIGEAAAALENPDAKKVQAFRAPGEKTPVIFMFSGQGSQYINMGLDIYREEPSFQADVDRCLDILKTIFGHDIKSILYPPEGGDNKNKEEIPPQGNRGKNQVKNKIDEMIYSGPIKFILDYSLAKLLMKWGIKPTAMIGHSFGEYVAACLSGVFSLEDALKLVVLRGRLIEKTARGSMMSIPLSEQELKPLLNDELSLAAVNTPSLCIVSGSRPAVDALEKKMNEEGYECVVLNLSHAGHSKTMDPILEEFEKNISQLTRNKPKIPYISNVTGKFITAEEAVNPAYYAAHMRQTVRFSDGITLLLKNPNSIFIQVGPGRGLTLFVDQHLEKSTSQLAINLLRHPKEDISDMAFLLNKIGLLWLSGLEIDWPAFYADEKRYRIPLPSYPFDRQRFWKCADSFPENRKKLFSPSLDEKIADIAKWFYVPSWKPSAWPARKNQLAESPGKICWLLFMDKCGIGEKLVKRLEQQNQNIIRVTYDIEAGFAKINDGEFTINPRHEDDYDTLFNELRALQKIPGKIFHLWGVTAAGNENDRGELDLDRVRETLDLGFYSLIDMAKAIGKQDFKNNLTIGVVTDNMYRLHEQGAWSPGKAAVIGPIRTIPVEYPGINCFGIDIVIPAPGSQEEERLLDRLLSEMMEKPSHQRIALRGNYRLVETFVPVELNKPGELIPRLREEGVYLIMGGLGGVGLVLAKYLARTVHARLILVGRSPFPAREDWEELLSQHGEEDGISTKIRKVKELEQLGARVLILNADITDKQQMQEMVNRAEEHFGRINGVIHSTMTVDGAVIARRTRQMTEKVVAAKVTGTLVLDEILGNKQLDFFVLCSSVAAFHGQIGEVGYCAANLFQDAYAMYKNDQNGNNTFTISINWDTWKEVGQAIQTAKSLAERYNTDFSSLIEHGMLTEEGIEAFRRALDSEFPHIAVHTRDIEIISRQRQASKDEEPGGQEELEEVINKGPMRQRPELKTGYVAPTNEQETQLAEIWKAFFGIEPVGILDDFFELGGDSLKAMVVSSIIQKKLNIKVSITRIFTSPTIKELAQFIKENTQRTEYYSIEPVEKRDYYPLSPAQKRLYILQLIEKESTGYNEQIVFQLEGELDVQKMEAVFGKMIHRHESLRTSFAMIEGESVQRIHHHVEFAIEYNHSPLDHQVEPMGNPGPAANDAEIIKTFVRPFDTGQAPLLRVLLIKLGDNHNIVVLDMHHLVLDGTSQEIFVKEFVALYKGETLLPIPIQYKDFSQWQESHKGKKEIKKEEEFWLDQFRGEIPVINLPADYPRPLMQSFNGDSLNFVLDKEETKALRILAEEESITLFMLILSIYNILLSRLTGQEDIVVGTPIAGRNHPDLGKIIGMFVNTLAMRNYPLGEKSVRGFIQEVKTRTLKVFENQDYQFEDLVENVEVNRDVSRNPIFDVMFVMVNLYVPSKEVPEVEIPGLRVRPYDYRRKASKFDMTFFVAEAGENMSVTIEYCTDLFKEETIRGIYLYFRQIISIITAHPEMKISGIQIISEKEKHQILYDFNNTDADYDNKKTIYQLFQKQVRKKAANVALVYENERLTYKQLNEATNQLAYQLRGKGVQPNHPVGIMVERSIEMVVGILAVLKAGGAYLPFDPAYPEARINLMVKDSGMKWLLVGDNCNVNIGDTCETIHLGTGNRYKGVSEDPENVNISTDMAYVIYTSGSTGKPKGVMVEHTSIINTLIALQNRYPLMETDAYLLKTSYIFDVSLAELFGWFFEGGRLAILEKGGEKNPQQIFTTIENQVVTHINFVPSMFNVFVESLQPKNIPQLSPLRYIFLAGEAIMAGHLEKILQLNTGITLENIYGPTEAAIYGSWYSLSQWDGKSSIPIGKPLTNVKLYILDKNALLQPIGIPGELCIAGAGVARGYLNNPELTAEKFRSAVTGSSKSSPNDQWPMTNDRTNKLSPNDRLYKTGDLARWLSDGNVEFVGRIDNQVKVRGFRVELGDIENKLLNHDHIKEAVVSTGQMIQPPGEAREGQDNYLCAYFVSDVELTIGVLKEFLSMQLPDYMIPSYFVQMKKIPLSPSGKLDRKALPLPFSDGSRPKLDVTYVAPKTDNEKTIARVWMDTLKIEKLGIHDNFFDIGGNSLKLIQVNNKLIKALNIDIPMVKMFEYPTINSFVTYLTRGQKEDDWLNKEIEQLDIKHDQAVNIMEQTLLTINED